MTISRITSYINNLHPGENQPLYGVIEKIIAKAIVLWNHTLDPLKGGYGKSPARIPFDYAEYGSIDDISLEDRPAQEPGEDDESYEERLEELTLIPPSVAEFEDPEETKLFSLREEFAEQGLQVIVKLANIHLTPEKPEYGGGTWHVEGQLVGAFFSSGWCLRLKKSVRTSIFAPPHCTTMIPPTSPKAAWRSANNRTVTHTISTMGRGSMGGCKTSSGARTKNRRCNTSAPSSRGKAASSLFQTSSSIA